MAKYSRDKGSAFERKVAKKFGDKYGRSIRRTPASGGLDIRCDIYDPFDADFPLFIECKNRKSYRFETLLNGKSTLYAVWENTKELAMQSKREEYYKSPDPVVVFRGGQIRTDMVIVDLEKYGRILSLFNCIVNIDYRVCICKLDDFLRIDIPFLVRRDSSVKVLQEDDGEI